MQHAGSEGEVTALVEGLTPMLRQSGVYKEHLRKDIEERGFSINIWFYLHSYADVII